MRIALGIPVIVAMTHPLVAGPVTNTLFYDFQRFPSKPKTNSYAHVGAPSATLECKLIGVEDDVVKAGVYQGEVSIRKFIAYLSNQVLMFIALKSSLFEDPAFSKALLEHLELPM